MICLKRVEKRHANEIPITQFLSEPQLRADPYNHSVPFLDALLDFDDKYHILVIPFLRPYNDPPFLYVEEVVEFVRQTLQVRLV